jgi:transposase
MAKVDWDEATRELAKGVSYKTLYKELSPSEVSYWTFWKTLKRRAALPAPTKALLVHKPGECVQVDYAQGINIVCPVTGEVSTTQLFVGVLPFSQKVFAEFTTSQKLPSFIESHERMWEFFGGVTQYTTPDNLKSAVTRAHIYDPDLNKTFCDYANHAGFAVLPARPVRPRDKASAEGTIGVLQRTFFESVRKKTFTSLAELNAALKAYLAVLNASVMKDYGVSRDERFAYEKGFLGPVPQQRFEISEWKTSVVHPDCHIQVAKGLYSVPWTYVGKKVRVRLTSRVVEIFDQDTAALVCSHSRSQKLGERKTNAEHWPPEKRSHLSFDIAAAKAAAAKIGPTTSELVTLLFDQAFPLRHLRMVQGMLRLVNNGRFTPKDLEYAARCGLNHSTFRLAYLTACCQFHARGGARPQGLPSSLMPERDLKTIHLQHANKGPHS